MRLSLLLVLGHAWLLLASQSPDYPHGGGPCSADWDCALAGECASGRCACDPWATGAQCDLLNLVDAATDAQGMQVPNYHSWGGHALQDPASGEFHGFFSFLCRHATLSEWTTKSSIWRATASSVEGPYALQDMVAQPWAHNAMISQTGNASAPYALYQLGDSAADPSLFEPCYNASETSAGFAAPAAPAPLPSPQRRASGSEIYLRTAPSLAGPWTTYDDNAPLVFTFDGSFATAVNGANPAPLFFPNGTVLMYFSANPCPPDWGNKSPGNNCIFVARGTSMAGPFAALPLPVTHPESEDAHVFATKRGYHLLTNVNNDHARCAAGVPCGGHAWSLDGITFSNLTIGAFGPYIRFANGSSWPTAYVERPQVTQAADGSPLAFFVGVGRASYDDSATWAQRFCTGAAGETCGPMLPPPPPPQPQRVTFALPRAGAAPLQCLATNASSFPCAGGWGNSCPLFLAPCASPAAAWLQRSDGLLESAAWPGQCLNRDCNGCSAGTALKAMPCDGNGSPVAYSAAAGGQLSLAQCPGSCVSDGSLGHAPVCKAGEQMAAQQLAVEACSQGSTQGWLRSPA